ncbi:methyltransferase domain protein [Ehrlichia chaffeensis str. Heartland]|uniref:TPR domain protein n=1 Tax=Ehrlichia chaffeensis (strain ATCC CRL-10679 / Arkansas) TaxID=205920 RepID=Q2GI54_EHRCR|nr:methyltransferase domain-containing protein [Ehrlichia chaffeensis]ABD45407.1 TPR domain protein [Ehrlichia chaffeensis str. Arkansas]AHX04134.1 methyltransferase domain protein [Ehrlichia chaffeensis str. Heartland]AHX06070.1 methyltransferase domain protein [Ehrlichia chaffeensis str. Jax]AHX07059.1 methyltransferase domain protein [Ehrlichia chaffeensis str. Liberty]AHX07376.1 methyltransferase domain protein [Ehrlichia chaffeensis str. Osceola]
MKSNFFITKRNVSSLISSINKTIPKPQDISQSIKNKITSIKKEAILLQNKLKNLLETNIDLGLYHFYKGNISDAKFRFRLISIFKPKLPVVYYNIGRCYFTLQNFNKAQQNFTRAIELDNNYADALYYLNKITNPESIVYVPENIIKQYFDYTSEHFVEHWLIAKQYKAHEYVKSLIINFFGNKSSYLNILDLGCGTGICGQFLKMKSIGNHITGIDISNKMINIARGCFVNGKQAYNELINISIFDFLKKNQNKKKYNVIILTEVLQYTGSLNPILKLLKTMLETDGIIIGLARRKKGSGFQFINEGDFFCHSDKYIKSSIIESGLQCSYSSYCKIYGSQVEGILFVAQSNKIEV